MEVDGFMGGSVWLLIVMFVGFLMIGKTTSKTLIVELQNFILINISFKKI
jgi:hypothetical protein